ncbi:MAG: hypothetical protein Q7S43_04305 [bacterium]|nr:hypothetical protein [bacterium]
MPDKQLKHRLDFVGNSDEIARKLHRRYRIQGLAEILLPIFVKANLDEEDTHEAVEQAIKEVF